MSQNSRQWKNLARSLWLITKTGAGRASFLYPLPSTLAGSAAIILL